MQKLRKIMKRENSRKYRTDEINTANITWACQEKNI